MFLRTVEKAFEYTNGNCDTTKTKTAKDIAIISRGKTLIHGCSSQFKTYVVLPNEKKYIIKIANPTLKHKTILNKYTPTLVVLYIKLRMNSININNVNMKTILE